MKRLLLVLLIGMFMLSFTSAYFEFDNYYTYNETSRTASFKNGLTLGASIAKIRLNTPLDMPVPLGYNYVFELELWGDVAYSDFVRGIYVHDKKNGYSIINRDIDLKYFNGYETKYINISGCLSEGFSVNGTLQCNEYGIIGTEEYQVEVWDDLLPRDLKNNDHLIIRGYTNVEFGDKMEWYIDFFGAGKNTGHGTKGVKEWAVWTQDLNVNITAYYKFEELSGPVIDSTNKHNGTNNGATTGATGIILNGYDFDGTDNIDASNSITGSFSYSAWINPSSFPGSFQNTVIQGGNSGQSNTIAALAILNNHVWFRTRDDDGNPLSDLEGSTTVSTNNFVHIGVTYNAATGEKIVYLNGSNDGSQTDLETMTVDEITMGKDPVSAEFWDGVIDEVGIWGRVLTPTEMVQLFNNGVGITFVNISEGIVVTLNSPANNTIQSNTLVEFNWTITPTNINITNWTLSVFFENGTLFTQEINTTISTNETTLVLHNETVTDGNYIWNVESCGVGTDDFCDLSENRTFSIDTLTPLLNITSPPDGFIVTEALQNITINFTINDSGGTLDQCWLNTSLNSTPIFIVCADNVTSALYPASNPDNVTLFLSANDTAGNTGVTNVTVFKNTVSPIVNITAPVNGFVVTEFNQSINLNWTNDNVTLDSCFYILGEQGGLNQSEIPTPYALDTNFSFTYNDSRSDELLLINHELSFGDPSSAITEDFSLGSCTTNLIVATAFCESPGLGTSCINNFTCGATLIASIATGTNAIFEAKSILSIDQFSGNYSNITVTCSLNSTIINYPNSNPDNLLITFFSNDTFGNLGSDNVTIFKSQVAPTINITAPADNFSLLLNGQSLDLNFTMTNSTILDTCIFLYNGVNTSVTCEQSVSTTFTYVAGVNTITVFVNDTLSNSNSSIQTWTVDAVENNITFNATTFETKTESFITNLSINTSTVVSVTSILNYNGTRFTADSDCSGDICLISTAIDIPLIVSGENESREWFYEVTVFSATSQITTNTTISTQNVTRIHLEICNATFTNQTLNFTSFDEQTLATISPFMFNADFQFWLGTGSNFRNSSFEQPSVSSVQLCILPGTETYTIDGNVEYDEASGSIYTVRNYFFQDDLINSTSQDIPLGLLLSNVSTSFILKLQDADILPLTEALIFTQRFYPGTGEFITVQVGKSDDNGKTVGFFEAETADYRFIIKRGGIVLLITPDGERSQKVVGEETPFTLTFTVGEDEGASWEDFEDLDEFTSSLVFNETTEIVSFVFEDTSADFDLALLQVFRLNASGPDFLLCNESLSQSAGLLTCNIAGNSTGTYIAKGIIVRDGDRNLVEQIGFEIQDFAQIAGRLGLFLGWFIILIAALSFKFNEIAGIILTNAAMIFVNLIGLINFGITWITAWIALSIMLLVVLER